MLCKTAIILACVSLCPPSSLFVKIKRAPAQITNPQKLKAMTAVLSTSNYFEDFSDNSIRMYQIYVVKFDGTCELVTVEAQSLEEAKSHAVSKVDDADYAFLYDIY